MACCIVAVAQRAFRGLFRRQPVHVVVIVRRGPAGVGHSMPFTRSRVRKADRGLARRRAGEQPVQVVVGIGGDRAVEMRHLRKVAVVVVLPRFVQRAVR